MKCRKFIFAGISCKGVELIIKKSFIILMFISAVAFSACGSKEPIVNWRQAYDDFLSDSLNYYEDGYYAGHVALFDFDKNNILELIITYFDGVQGGNIFANIYSYDGDVIIIKRQADAYYMSFSYSGNPLFNGLFVQGGRSSNFNCYYWILEDGEFITKPLWSDKVDNEGVMVYEELSDNKQLIAEAEKSVELPFIDIDSFKDYKYP